MTRAEAEQALEFIEATWPVSEIEFLRQLPAREQMLFVEVAMTGGRPIPEPML